MKEIPSLVPEDEPAKKRASKKVAAKKATTEKVVAKKAAAKKSLKVQEVTDEVVVAASTKKAAKKVAKKAIASQAELSPELPLSAESPAPPIAKKRAARKTVTRVEQSVAVIESSPAPSAPAPQVIPTPAPAAAIEVAESRPTTVEATPFPAARAPQPHVAAQRPPHHSQDQKKNKFGKNKKNGFDRQGRQKGKAPGHGGQQVRGDQDADRANVVLEGPKVEVTGLLELTAKGSGFLRSIKKNFELHKDDAFVSAALVNKWGLRHGAVLQALTQMGPRGPQVVELLKVNEMPPEEARRLPHFEELTAVNPSKRIPFENSQNRFTTRVLDIVAPVGRGQRGLIVSPPRSGKTTLMLHIAESVMQREDDQLHLMVLLVDERPEEVTEFRRALPGVEIIASSNDEHPRNHCRVAELTIERAKRLVEAGKHVFLLMDSITRLARAYNNTGSTHGRGIGSGGVTVGALEIPRRLFAAARNTRGGGSLTILATALIQTNSRADEAIFQEFKGTGNMEIVLDRKIAENYIYPAVDIFKSGTRREELLLPEHMLHKIHLIRRGLSGHKPLEAMERLTYFLKKFPSNAQMLLEIKG